MPERPDPGRALERAAQLWPGAMAEDELVEREGRLSEPLPVTKPDGSLESWFVGVTVGDKLAGFLQLLPDLTFVRYSSFQRQPGTVEGCPEAADWLDPGRISRRAASRLRSDESAGRPRLTYDATPSRVVWAVPVESRDGSRRELLVAGDFVYEAAPGA
jgi:hypothetical protein